MYVLKKRKKINRMFSGKKIMTYQTIDHTVKFDIDLFDAEMSYGNHILTTIISKKKNIISLLSYGDSEI